jgi:predicted Zn-ribbon and HTH transcriptional regulator
VCLSCGYRFDDRRRATPPGRCPRCKQSHIQRPQYGVR